MATKASVINDVVVDLNFWTMKDFQSFTTAISNSDFDTVAPLASKAITWGFEGAVDDVDVWNKLSMVQVAHVLHTVKKAVEAVFAEGN